MPSFTGSLFGTAVRMFAEALGGAGSPFASAANPEAAALKQTNGIPEFPRRFSAQEAVSLTADALLGGLQRSRSQGQRLTWDLNDPQTGQYLGRLDQQGVGDPSSTIHFHNPQGATVAKATRVWALESKKSGEDAPLIERGRGQVISLVNTRTNARLGRVVEFAPWSYGSPVTRWLNGLYTSFVVLDDRDEEAALVRRYSVPRLFSYYRGIDTNGQRLVEFKLPLSLLRWKTRWTFERVPTAVDTDTKKKGRLSLLVFPVMAAFHTIDTQQSSLFKRILG
jgi:hypothetical protein